MKEDGRAVLCAPVGPLTIELRGIVVLPEDFQQLVIRKLRCIVVHFDSLGVSGAISTDVFVSRISRLSAGITDASRNHARQLTKCRFHSPETASGKGSFGHDVCSVG